MGGLELQQQQQIGVPTLPERDAPDDIAVAALAGGGVEFRVDPLHRVEVQIGDPGFGDEFAQELRDHAGVAEQAVVEGVVVLHPRSLRTKKLTKC